MFTVTMGRTLSALAVAASAAVVSTSAAAQIVIRTDGAGIAGANVSSIVQRAVQIPDDSVRSYLTRFEPGVLDDDSGDASIVTMVLDNDGTYLRSTSHRAKVIEAVPGRIVSLNGEVRAIAGTDRIISINGDSLRAMVAGSGRVISINGDSASAFTISTSGDAPTIATAGSVIAVNTMRAGAASASPTMLAGVSPDEIGGIATKRYSAGQMGRGPVIVTFIYLK